MPRADDDIVAWYKYRLGNTNGDLKMRSMFSMGSKANQRTRQGTQCIEHFVAIFCVNSSGGNIPHNVALHQRPVGTMDGDANLGRP